MIITYHRNTCTKEVQFANKKGVEKGTYNIGVFGNWSSNQGSCMNQMVERCSVPNLKVFTKKKKGESVKHKTVVPLNFPFETNEK